MLVKISFDEVDIKNSGDEGLINKYEEAKKRGFKLESLIFDVDTSKVTIEEIYDMSKDVVLEVLSY